MAQREYQPFVEARPRDEIEAVVEDKTAGQFVDCLARRDLRDPVRFAVPHAGLEREQLLSGAVLRHIDQPDLDVAAIQQAFGDRGRLCVNDVPASGRQKFGERFVGCG